MSFVLDKIGTLVTLSGAVEKKGRNISSNDLGIIHDACLVVGGSGRKSKVLWSGARSELPSKFKKLKKITAGGKMVLPGFVDSHTHLVFAGDRSREFEMRLAGKSYQEIAAQGGGIINSVRATRELSAAELYKLSLQRVQNFLKQGVTTIEIKTGYGLSFESEKKCLEVIKKLKNGPATIFSTFLAAHAVPKEFKNRKEEYIREISEKWLPKLHKLCDYVDIFLDEGYFNQEDTDILFKAAQKFNVPTKIHADELALTGGTQTAVNFKSLSADHLLKITDREIELLAENEVTATLLPTTAFFLKTAYAPARKLLDQGARVALATDFNPGTSPTQDISLVGTLSALEMNMRIEEVIVGLTLNGAYALGLEKSKGALITGFDSDFFLVEGDNPAKLFYEFGSGRTPVKVFSSGKWI
jgi:imidazolonepropionase